jgi:hypothetical protein
MRLLCPYCGWCYEAPTDGAFLVPVHTVLLGEPRLVTASALEAVHVEEVVICPGGGQNPRNPNLAERLENRIP